MNVFLLLSAFLGITLFEVPGLIQKRYWRELIAFFVFLSIAFILSFLLTIGVKIPNPTKGIEYVVKFFLNLFTKLIS